MNPKNLLYFMVGSALGAGLTFILLKEKYRTESEEAIEEVKKYYKRFEEKPEEKGPEEAGVPLEKGSLMDNYYTTTYMYKPSGDPISNDISDDDKDLEDDYDEDDEVYALHPEEPASAPYVIGEADFVGSNNHYDKVGLFYYSGTNTVVDENDEIVEDWERLIGPDIGARFKLVDAHDEPFSYIYIRNDQLGADYEVALRNEDF